MALLAAAGLVRRARITIARRHLYWQSTRHPLRAGFEEVRKNSERQRDWAEQDSAEDAWRVLMGSARFEDVPTAPGTLVRLIAPPSRSMIGNAADMCTRF